MMRPALRAAGHPLHRGTVPPEPHLTENTTAERSDDLYRAIVDTAVDGIVVIDAAGAIRSVNRAVEATFGYAASEMLGRNVRMLMPEPYASEHDSYLNAYLHTGHRQII